MLKIGIDKTDKTFRHFEYDDERKYGNPLVYKVLYEESGDFGEVMCSNVMSIKKSNSVKNHFLDIPIYDANKKVDEPKLETSVISTKPSDVTNEVVAEIAKPEEKKKAKTTKAKTTKKSEPLKVKPVEVNEPAIEMVLDIPKSYEYDVIVIDNISHIEDIKSKLNEYGKDGWEVCGFQTVNKVISCQMIIILKKGLK